MADDRGPEPDGDAPAEGPRDVNPADRFTLAGKTLDLADLVRSSMGDLAERTPVDPEPQPEAQPFSVIWGARRPAPNAAEADLPADGEETGGAAAENDS